MQHIFKPKKNEILFRLEKYSCAILGSRCAIHGTRTTCWSQKVCRCLKHLNWIELSGQLNILAVITLGKESPLFGWGLQHSDEGKNIQSLYHGPNSGRPVHLLFICFSLVSW